MSTQDFNSIHWRRVGYNTLPRLPAAVLFACCLRGLGVLSRCATVCAVLILSCSGLTGCTGTKGAQNLRPRLLFESSGLLPSEVVSQGFFIATPSGFQIQPTEVLIAFGYLVTKPRIRIFSDGESYYFDGSHMTKISTLPYLPGFGYKIPGKDLASFSILQRKAVQDYRREPRFVWEAWR